MKAIILSRSEIRLADLDQDLLRALEIEALDGEARLQFSYPQDQDAAVFITEGNKIATQDMDGNWQLFEIISTEVSIRGGRRMVEVREARHISEELDTDALVDLNLTSLTATQAITNVLENTIWQVGTVQITVTRSQTIPSISPRKALQRIKNTWGGELRFRVTVSGNGISGRYVDLLTRLGAYRGKRFEFGHDLTGISIEVDRDPVRTAMYGWGVGQEMDAEGNVTRLDFSTIEWVQGVPAELYPGGPTSPAPVNKPLGQTFVGDPVALAAYGRWNPGTQEAKHVFGEYKSQAIFAQSLLWETWRQLTKAREPLVNVKATQAALEQLEGYEHEKVRLGDTNIVKVPRVEPLEARVIRIERDRKDPRRTKLELGNFLPTSSQRLDTIVEEVERAESHAGIWDRADSLNPDGTVPTSILDGTINAINNLLLGGGGNVRIDGDGFWILDTNDPATAKGAVRGVANEGKAALILGNRAEITEAWDWRVGLTSENFRIFGEEIVAGKIATSLVKIEGDTNFYWDGTGLFAKKPGDANTYWRFDAAGLRFTKDGGTTWHHNLAQDKIFIGSDAEFAGTIMAGAIVQSGNTLDTFPVPAFLGAWQAATYYYRGDVVTYGGSTWIFVNTTPGTTTPVHGTDWNLYSAKGDDGAAGEAGSGLVNRGNWGALETYYNNDYVFDRSTGDPLINSMWVCSSIAGTSGTQPYLDTGNWNEFEAPQGEQGPKGDTGETGETGQTGAAGKTYVMGIVGGKRTILYDEGGINPTPTMTAFSAELYEDGVLITTGLTYAWTTPGGTDSLLTGSGSLSTFTPTVAGTFDAAKADNRVALTLTYAGMTLRGEVPVSMTKVGDQGLTGDQGLKGDTGDQGNPGAAYNLNITGGTRTILYDKAGLNPTPSPLTAFGLELSENGEARTPATIAWSTPGGTNSLLSGSGSLSTFTPSVASSFDLAKSDNRVALVVTYAGLTIKSTVPVAITKIGDDGLKGDTGDQGLKGDTGTAGKTYVMGVTGGKRTILYDEGGINPAPTMTAFSAELYEDGTLITSGLTYAWTTPGGVNGLLSGSGSLSTFTPTVAGTFDPAKADNRVALTLTYSAMTFRSEVPVSMTKIGDDGLKGDTGDQGGQGIPGAVYNLSITGGTRTILYNAGGTSPLPSPLTAFGYEFYENGEIRTPGTRSWTTPGGTASLLSGSGTGATFTPTVAGTFDTAKSDNRVMLTITYSGLTIKTTVPVAMTKIGDTGLKGDKGDKGDTGDTGPGVVFRGAWTAGTRYYYTATRRDVVLYSGNYRLFNVYNEAGSETPTWVEGQWASFGIVFDSIATGLLLTQAATILQVLTMGTEGTSSGIIRSVGLDKVETVDGPHFEGTGFWLESARVWDIDVEEWIDGALFFVGERHELDPSKDSYMYWTGTRLESRGLWVTESSGATFQLSGETIITKVVGSDDLLGVLGNYALSADLGAFASQDEFDSTIAAIHNSILDLEGVNLDTEIENWVTTNTEIIQTAADINFRVSQAGGINLVKNSVGYASLDYWTEGTVGTVKISRGQIQNLPFETAFYWEQVVGSRTLSQDVSVAPGYNFTLSWHGNKMDAGATVTVEVLEGATQRAIKTYASGDTTDGYERESLIFTPVGGTVTVTVTVGSNIRFGATGFMVNAGQVPLQWSQHMGEVYNANISMDASGITVARIENGQPRGYTKITPYEFAGYYDGVKIFWLEESMTVSKKFQAEDEIIMGPIKARKIDETGRRGWAFVPNSEMV